MSEQPAETTAVSTGRLAVEAALRTDVGLVRSENQDFGTVTTPEEERDSHPGGRLLVVADGMGGHRGGATASKIAGETVKAQYLGSETTDIAAAIHDALLRANARIYSEAQANPDLRGMGTTTSALVIRDGQGWFGHVGDSRIYLVRGDEIRQLTDDHSLVASMVREGLLTSKEAETHPRRNVLQRSMGVAEEVDIDVRGPLDVQEGDTYILCSDGLHGVVKEPELKEVAKLSIDRAADEFVKLAMERGAPDNVTVIVARVVRSIDGDDTVIDRPRAAAVEALDETQRDTDRIPIIAVDEIPLNDDTHRVTPLPPGEGGQRPGEGPGESEHDFESDTPLIPRSAVPSPEGRRSGSSLKWFLLAAAAIGAASAWLFLSR
jgi:serine/threonine protein phosphatase PrpC